MKSDRALRKAIRELDVKEPGSSDDVVSQQKLRQYESLQDELRALTKKFAAFRADMKDVMKSGASVSTGKRGLQSGIRFRRHPSYKQALIEANGEEYQQKVLERTQFRPYYYVRLITTPKNGGE
jgi:predicted  nucleic acid-binding Zn-ribbon protein